MRRTLLSIIALVLAIAAWGQTLKITTSSGTKEYQASQVTANQPATFTGGTTLTVADDVFTISDITNMLVVKSQESAVKANTVNIVYNGSTATVTMADNVSNYVTAEVSGAHVTITQTNTDAIDGDEITYVLSGSTTDGSLTLDGSYKCTVSLAGLTMTNPSGAAINITNKKRIQLSVKEGTESTLTDGTGGSQKACVYSKGQLQLQGKGTLNVVGNTKHAIKSGDYISVKNLTLNITKAVGDGISCEEYFLMKSGSVIINGVGDDGIQCDLGGDSSTVETTDHDDEDSGNIYLEGGTLNITVTAAAAKGIKADGDMRISGGAVTVKTTGGGAWDSDDKKTKASSCLSADGNMTISGGTLNLTSTGAGGKGINGDGSFTATGGTMTIKTSGNAVVASSSGTISTVSSSQQLDRYKSDYKSSPKGIKIDGAITISDNAVISVTTTGAGGEGIESKTNINISGGQVTVNAKDDAINSSYNDATKGTSGAADLTISGGYVYARSTGNDGLDANGNCYIKGGLIYAIGTTTPEVAIDANSEEQKKLYVTGGTIIAIGGLESGSSLTQSCYSTSSWNKNTWYAMTVGSETFAFQTPSSGGSTLVVSGASQPTLKSGVTVSSGTKIFDGVGYTDATVTGGSNVNLSSYTGGGGPGGGGSPGGWH
ncbi:MAG: carbohydrate-binding domain-containing protein [Prevotella sp.]|nr:carbohydrate-binding domain-containing protein [Prevotella sp.]